MNVVGEIIFIDKFLRDVSKFDAHVFRTVHRGHKVEVLDVKACTFRITSREDTVNDQFDKVEGCCGSAYVARVADAIATNRDSRSIRVILLFSVFTHDFGVSNFTTSINGNVIKVDDVERSRSFGTLVERTFLPGSNALTHTPKFIGVRFILDFLILWVFAKLSIF